MQKPGFTLLETIVVVAIIALLSVLAIMEYENARSHSRDSRRVTDVSLYVSALTQYRVNNGSFGVIDASRTLVGANQQGYGRIHFKNGSQERLPYPNSSSIADILLQKGFLASIPRDPSASDASNDSTADVEDYVLIRCSQNNTMQATTITDQTMAVWTHLEQATTAERIDTTSKACGGTHSGRSTPFLFGYSSSEPAAFFPAPSLAPAGFEATNNYFSIGTQPSS